MIKWFAFSWRPTRHFKLLRFTRTMSTEAALPAKRFCSDNRASSEQQDCTEKVPKEETAEDIEESEDIESGKPVRASRASTCSNIKLGPGDIE